jgi:hypothetical protein
VNFLELLEENIGALLVSLIAAGFAALGAWVLTIFIGVKFFRDEWSYGIPLLFGVPAGLVAGVATFLVVFRKLR